MNFAYSLFLGKPLIFYFGILTITSVFTTAFLGYLSSKGKRKAFKWHVRLAILSLILALIHRFMGISSFLP
jgi:Ca2+/H+ antiporter